MVSQGSAETSLRWDIQCQFCSKFCASSSSKRILKIDQYFTKLSTCIVPLEVIVCVYVNRNTLGVLYISYSVSLVDDQRHK